MAEVETRATEILKLAAAAGLKVTTAESCTGGLVAAAITEIAGASAIFERGFVTYSNQAKIEMLGVSARSLSDFGAVSEAVAREMAEGALYHARADVAVSVTGIAGPGGSEYKPEGRVCFGLAAKGLTSRTETLDFGPQGRAMVRKLSLLHALSLLKIGLNPAERR